MTKAVFIRIEDLIKITRSLDGSTINCAYNVMLINQLKADPAMKLFIFGTKPYGSNDNALESLKHEFISVEPASVVAYTQFLQGHGINDILFFRPLKTLHAPVQPIEYIANNTDRSIFYQEAPINLDSALASDESENSNYSLNLSIFNNHNNIRTRIHELIEPTESFSPTLWLKITSSTTEQRLGAFLLLAGLAMLTVGTCGLAGVITALSLTASVALTSAGGTMILGLGYLKHKGFFDSYKSEPLAGDLLQFKPTFTQ